MNKTRKKTAVALMSLAMGAAGLSAVGSGAATAATCSYPGTIATTTTASSRARVPYGRAAKLTAVVQSDSGTPTGDVAFKIDGTSFSKTGTLSSGTVSKWLGRGLPAQHVYSYTEDYLGDCDWAGSTAHGSYRVIKAGTATVAVAQNISQGETVHVKVKVASLTHFTPHGKVRIALRHNGRVIRHKVVRLTYGSRRAAFFNMRMTGRWTAVATYLGAHNFKRSRAWAHFHVS